MARYTLTTTPTQIAAGGELQARSRSVAIVVPAGTGTVLLERGPIGSAPSMTNAARFDFSKIPALTYYCDPGIALWAATSSGTVDVDVLPGGEI